MSSSTTTTTRAPAELSLRTVLADYGLYHSSAPAPSAARHGHDRSTNLAQSPTASWDSAHRRVPPYRPINRQRDPLETGVYTSTVERIFISVMFTGVFINSAAAKTWRQTFGRVNENIFRYPVGGEI